MEARAGFIARALAPLFVISLWTARIMAALCCVLIAIVAGAIVYDVSVRTLGQQPPNFTVSFTEYVLLYVTMLGAPYMARQRGHIVVEALIANVPDAMRTAMAKFVYLVCAVLCAALAWYGGKLAWESWATSDMEYRSFDMPRWILDVTLPLGFGFTAIEFLRYLVTDADFFRVRAEEKDGF